MKEEPFSPVIIIFTCTHNPYGALQLLGAGRRVYPSGFIPLTLPCAGALAPAMLLKAFEKGVDGVLLLRCPEERCLHKGGSELAEQTAEKTAMLMSILGIDTKRLRTAAVALEESALLEQMMSDFHTAIVEVGPNELRIKKLGAIDVGH